MNEEPTGDHTGAQGTMPCAPAARLPARTRLLDAAERLFCQHGYLPVTVEEIAAAAGVSRVTFYRQFAGKEAITVELFRMLGDQATPHFARIGALDYHDPLVVGGWIAELFAADVARQSLLRAFTQALVAAPDFLGQAQALTTEIIRVLGQTIPAFSAERDDPAQRRQWLEAWLLLYEIMDRSNHAALGRGEVIDPMVIDILAERFVAFVARHPGPVQASAATFSSR